MMNVYRYHGYVSVINAIILAEEDIQQGREYVKRNGHPYLFDPPHIDILLFRRTHFSKYTKAVGKTSNSSERIN